MDQKMREWGDAVRRLRAAHERVAQLSLAELPVPPEMLADVAALEEEVLVKLRAVYRSKLDI
ncbi:hypothetical protein [Pseudorhodoferax sp. Leaf267]|uniref:hypothetical protein n=1 Tax=Pseudorhodoferax sp. Leaf267 TaxID=1736316 RepID=UPI0012E2AE37|nr:hypothetical protein [Pseudorhodoferax sp. Leaf267]